MQGQAGLDPRPRGRRQRIEAAAIDETAIDETGDVPLEHLAPVRGRPA